MNLLISNKTTIAGVLLGMLTYAHSTGITIPSSKQDLVNLAIALLFAGFGFMAKDYNVTGGTVKE